MIIYTTYPTDVKGRSLCPEALQGLDLEFKMPFRFMFFISVVLKNRIGISLNNTSKTCIY